MNAESSEPSPKVDRRPPPGFADEASDLATRAARVVERAMASPDWTVFSALALGLTALIEGALYASDGDVGPFETALFGLLATLPLAARNRNLPVVAVIVTFATFMTLAVPEVALTLSGIFGQLCVAYLVAERYSRRWTWALGGFYLLLAIIPFSGDQISFEQVLMLVLVASALALGDSRRIRGEALAERDETRRAMTDTLRDQAAMEERARIARELHDVVAHHISAIAVQAEATRLTTAGMPEEGLKRLEEIGASARGALTEMRRVLGVLRDDSDIEPARSPLPGMDRLSELIDTTREAGGTVRLTFTGKVVPLSPGVDLCAYRIVQEALTNARRHAPGAAVDVVIAYGQESLHLRISDNGPGATVDAVEGHGLVGMHERAILVGGTLRHGPGENGGFLVDAVLPFRNSEA